MAPSSKASSPTTWLRGLAQAVIAIVCAAAMAMAFGAVWVAVMLRVPSASWWFALPVGAAMGVAVRAWVVRGRTPAMLLAAGGTLLATLYMKCLLVGLQLAAVMGLPYLHTLRRAGVGMLLALAHNTMEPRSVASCMVGVLLALVLGAGSPRKAAP